MLQKPGATPAIRAEQVRDVEVVLVLLNFDLVVGGNTRRQVVAEGVGVGEAAAYLVAELAREADRQVAFDNRGGAEVHVDVLGADRRLAAVVADADTRS